MSQSYSSDFDKGNKMSILIFFNLKMSYIHFW